MKPLVLLSDAYGGHGGIAKFNRDLLTAMAAYPGLERATAIPRLMPHPPEPIPSKLNYIISGLGGKGRYLRALVRSLAGSARGSDLIVCGHINLLPFAVLAKKLTGAPIALIIHGIDAWDPVTRRGTDYCLRQVDSVISVSKLTLERFQSWSGLAAAQAFVLPNSFEPGLFTPGPKPVYLLERYGLKRGGRILMTLGRLAGEQRQKGFDEVLEAMPELLLDEPSLRYLIVGNGSDRGRLEEKAARLGLSGSVVFTGMIKEEEKADHYRLADGFAMPSHGEGFGIVLLEAMACGVPALASKADGSSEALMHGKLGILVDPDSRSEVLAGIRRLLETPAGTVPKELGHFSFANYTERLHALLEELGGRSGTARSQAAGSISKRGSVSG